MPLVRAFIAIVLLAGAFAFAGCAAPPEPTLPQAEPAQFAAGASATPLPPMPGGPTPTPGVLYSGEPSMPDRIPVRWYVGLGAGSDPTLVEAQARIVDEFNASQGEIELLLEIVSNDIAAATLREQLENGQAPDLVGPIGIYGRASFPDEWLDLTPYIEQYNYDLGDFDPALVNFYRVEQGLVSIPFAVFPSFLLVNTDLFDRAGLPYPPQEYGRPYIDESGAEREWTMETLRDVAMKLTVDAVGRNAHDPFFKEEQITQFGYGTLRTDLRGRLSLFGAGNLVDEMGQATLPGPWREGLQWYYDGMWRDFFYPNAIYGNSELLNQGNWFESGNLAMGHAHLWYISCCMSDYPGKWTMAAVPSYNGRPTAKLHADSFTIMRQGQNPEAAFRVMMWLLGEKASDLAAIYGGMPARASLQPAYFDAFNVRYFGQALNWMTVTSGLAYPDIPSHEEALPAYIEARARYTDFAALIDSQPGLDLDAEVARLLADLQGIYAGAGEDRGQR